MSFDLPKLSDDSIEGEILYPFGPPIYHTDINHDIIDLFYKKESRLRLESIWINFQNKHDFNPPHNHTGLLSFIIFGDVDKRIFTEGGPPTNSEKSGQVSFTFGKRITPLQMTMLNIKPYKGLMFIFPSSLKHYVTPFWIDSERISMSGNYVLEQSNIPQR